MREVTQWQLKGTGQLFLLDFVERQLTVPSDVYMLAVCLAALFLSSVLRLHCRPLSMLESERLCTLST